MSGEQVANTLSRRALLVGLSTLTAGVAAAKAATAVGEVEPDGANYQLDSETIVTASLLDEEVARAFPLFNAGGVLAEFDAERQGAANDVRLFRIVTSVSVPETGEVLDVTGLLALPVGAIGTLPVVSWQHGTILSFDQVPSNLTKLSDASYALSDEADSLETLFNIHRFAANGYVVIAADYVGKGPLRHGRGEGYAVKDVTVATCKAMLFAGLAALQDMGLKAGPLFLNGWSQGALNTQWLHQALRAEGVEVAGTGVASPFNDLTQAFRYWAGRDGFALPDGVETYPAMPAWVSLCMIVVLGSYELHYGLDGLIETAVRPEHAAMARKYWTDYALDFDPEQPFPTGADLLREGFWDGFTDSHNSAFLRRLAGNVASYWDYDSPIRFIFGLADEAIHPEMVARALAAGGEQAAGVPVDRASHRATFLAGLYGSPETLGGQDNLLEWFRSLA